MSIKAIFLVFFVLLGMQFLKVFIYYDDYGFLSLSYGYLEPNVTGSKYTFIQLLNFLKEFFFVGNGRLLYYVPYLIVYKVFGLHGLQILLSSAITIFFYLSYRLAAKENKILLAVIVCFFYGLFQIAVLRVGVYWFAASVSYVLPAVPFLLLILSCQTLQSSKFNNKNLLLSCLLTYLASFSFEQWAAATMSFLFFFLVNASIAHRKIYAKGFALLAAGFFGLLPIICSPGVHLRMNNQNNSLFSQMNLYEKIETNFPKILEMLYSRGNKLFIGFLAITFLILMIYMFQQRIGGRKTGLVSIVAGLFMTGDVLMDYPLRRLGLSSLEDLFLSLCLLIISWKILQYFRSQQRIEIGFVFLSAICSLLCLVIVPGFPPRILIPFEFLSLLLMACIWSDLLSSSYRGIIYCMVPVLLILSSLNLIGIYRGYANNYQIHQENEARLVKAAQHHAAKNAILTIALQKLPNRLFAAKMVYDKGVSYMRFWMNEFYNLPKYIQYSFSDCPPEQDTYLVERVSGVSSDGLVENVISGTIRFQTGKAASKIVIGAYVPNTWSSYENSLALFIDDQRATACRIGAGLTTCVFPIEPSSHRQDLLSFRIEAARQYTINHFEPTSRDTRKISYILASLEIEQMTID